MAISVTEVLTFATGMATIFCPPAAISLYAAHTDIYPREIQKRIAMRLFTGVAAVLVSFAWVGHFLLRVLGITSVALSMTGGLILILWSVPMMLGRDAPLDRSDGEQSSSVADWQTTVAVPLVFPMSIGGAAISLVIATTSRFHSIIDLLAISLVCVADAGLIALTYYFTHPLSLRIGTMGMGLTKRVSGIVLTAIAVQMLAQGLCELLPGLAR